MSFQRAANLTSDSPIHSKPSCRFAACPRCVFDLAGTWRKDAPTVQTSAVKVVNGVVDRV